MRAVPFIRFRFSGDARGRVDGIRWNAQTKVGTLWIYRSDVLGDPVSTCIVKKCQEFMLSSAEEGDP